MKIELARKIYSMLEDFGLYADVYCKDDKHIELGINWGDWKHDHLAIQNIMFEKFFINDYKVKVTEEDGSDCYSAVHIIELV